jgi:hypothetical protein
LAFSPSRLADRARWPTPGRLDKGFGVVALAQAQARSACRGSTRSGQRLTISFSRATCSGRTLRTRRVGRAAPSAPAR